MDPELRDAAILRRIQSVMRYAAAHAPFYQRKWAAAGISPADIRSLDDFEHVPVVTKEELRRAQAEHPPFGDYLCVPRARGHAGARDLGHHRPADGVRRRAAPTGGGSRRRTPG